MRKHIRSIKFASRPNWWTLEEWKPRLIKGVWIPQMQKRAVTLHDELPF